VLITAPGSYLLTGNLSVADLTADGISVSAEGVVLDLNGFEIAGPAGGSGMGIGAGNGVAVRNGRVRNFGARGIFVDARSQIEDVLADGNGHNGIEVRDHSVVRRSTARGNLVGIVLGAGSTVEHSTAASNASVGIYAAGTGCVVVGNTAASNAFDGIGAGPGALVQGNTSYGNLASGLAALQGSTVIDNTVYGNAGTGIYAVETGSTINRNTVRGNGAWGLDLCPGLSAYRGNTISSNGGTVRGGVNLLANSCNGGTTCTPGACP
jgi:parallel beta-helix repeat protein